MYVSLSDIIEHTSHGNGYGNGNMRADNYELSLVTSLILLLEARLADLQLL